MRADLDDNRNALLAVAKEATPEAQVAKVRAISLAKTAPKAENQPAATKVVEATHSIGEVNRFAEFCRTNLPVYVAPGIPPDKVAAVHVSIAVITEWLDRFAVAMARVEGAKTANRCQESPPGPRGPFSVRQPTPLHQHEPELSRLSRLSRHARVPQTRSGGAGRCQQTQLGGSRTLKRER